MQPGVVMLLERDFCSCNEKFKTRQNKPIWSNIVHALAFIFVPTGLHLQLLFSFSCFFTIGKMVSKPGCGSNDNYHWLFYVSLIKPGSYSIVPAFFLFKQKQTA